MVDERARYFRRLGRLRRSARRWSVLAAGFGGAAAVLTPYQGIGLPDAAWMAAAGGSLALTLWRWSDLRAFAAQPAPPPTDPAVAAARSRARLVAAVESFPAARDALAGVRRQRTRLQLRGTAVAQPWDRLDRAARTLDGFADRLVGPAESARLEAIDAERALRELVERTVAVERALRVAPADARPPLETNRRHLLAQLDKGVSAYEGLVAAAASYVAEVDRPQLEHPAVARLAEAGELLRGVADGLAELRTSTEPVRMPR
jgi:hypothetical protein